MNPRIAIPTAIVLALLGAGTAVLLATPTAGPEDAPGAPAARTVPIPEVAKAESLSVAQRADLATYFALQPPVTSEGDPSPEAHRAMLKDKLAGMQGLVTSLNATAKDDEAARTDALLAVAEVFADLGRFVAAEPIPPGLDEEAEQRRRGDIEKRAKVQLDLAHSVLDRVEREDPDAADRAAEARARLPH